MADKNEILASIKKVFYEDAPFSTGVAIEIDDVEYAMDLFAKCVAIQFAHWLYLEGYSYDLANGWKNKAGESIHAHDLFNIYLNDK